MSTSSRPAGIADLDPGKTCPCDEIRSLLPAGLTPEESARREFHPITCERVVLRDCRSCRRPMWAREQIFENGYGDRNIAITCRCCGTGEWNEIAAIPARFTRGS